MSSIQVNSAAILPASVTPDEGAYFPELSSKDLAGRSVTLPRDFPAERTLLLVAFERNQQHDIDTWVEGMHLGEGKLPWLELPVINDPGAFMRWFIDGGMRRGIKDHRIWPHVVTLYMKKADFNAAMGITSESAIQVFAVDRTGKVLQREIGRYDNDASQRLRAALGLQQIP